LTVIAWRRRAALAGLQVGRRIRPRRRADVSALRVGDDDQAGRARVRADVLERLHPGRAERLEEGELRLHADRVRSDRVDHAAAEAGAGVGGFDAAEGRLARELDRQELGHRVEPDQKLAPLALDGLGEPIAEVYARRGVRLEVRAIVVAPGRNFRPVWFVDAPSAGP
jgi:hypothetical protein